ncbi:MAG TPA: hypothetical protein VG405_02175 [Solirubrobacteraceae bacterium]|jgi:hypothetical protein|nr:hypothetical protein [Solirubrobacteraceae bacterium]
MPPELDTWLDRPQIRIRHRREADAAPAELWEAAQAVRLRDARNLGRLVRLRIPGLSPDLPFGEMFRAPPFNPVYEDDLTLVSGLVGRIWTMRRDYPTLSGPEEFHTWSRRGTVRVLFGNWVEPVSDRRAVLVSETRVQAVDRRAWLGLAAVRPLISSSHQLISRDGMRAALRMVGDSRAARLAENDASAGQADGA